MSAGIFGRFFSAGGGTLYTRRLRRRGRRPAGEGGITMSEVKAEALLAAVRDEKLWIGRFTQTGYKAAFQEYEVRFGPAYREAVQSAGAEGLEALTAALLDGMEADWARQRPWNRSLARLNTRQMLVQYLSPLLLSMEERTPGCRALAESLRDGWAARWPKETYQMATWKALQGGFRRTILGFPVPEGFGGGGNRDEM